MLRPRLGLEAQNQRPLGDNLRITATKPSQGDETYTIPVGKSNPVRNRYNAVTIELEATGRLARRLGLEARAYDDAVAFRYVVPQQPSIQELRLTQESTQFQFAKDATAYPLFLAGFCTSYEDNYHVLPLSGIHTDWLMALPLLVDVPGTAWVAVTEAYIDRYAGMYLVRSAARRQIVTRAAGLPSLGVSVSSYIPNVFRTQNRHAHGVQCDAIGYSQRHFSIDFLASIRPAVRKGFDAIRDDQALFLPCPARTGGTYLSSPFK